MRSWIIFRTFLFLALSLSFLLPTICVNDSYTPFYVTSFEQGQLMTQSSLIFNSKLDAKISSSDNVESSTCVIEEYLNINDLQTNDSYVFQNDDLMNFTLESSVTSSNLNITSDGILNTWKNGLEPSYDDVNASTQFEDNNTFFTLNFTDTGNGGYGISNTKFGEIPLPSPSEFLTLISFNFRIPIISSNLQTSPHTLALEFRFNQSSIFFILSSLGGDFGAHLEANLTRPEGSNSLYIFCNDSMPFNWRKISLNLTKVIESYISQDKYNNFNNLETVFCYMITFTPDFYLELNIDNIQYYTTLLKTIPIIYQINENTYISDNGTLYIEFFTANFTFIAYETTPWAQNARTLLETNITRISKNNCSWYIKEWNDTQLLLQMDLEVVNHSIFNDKRIIILPIPTDWDQLSVINNSHSFTTLNRSHIVNEYINVEFFMLDITDQERVSFKASAPNYISDVIFSRDIIIGEYLEVRGNLQNPLGGDISLFLENGSFIQTRTTAAMVNASFIFPGIEITEEFPIGLIKLTVNYTNSWEFGVINGFVVIHDGSSQELEIRFNCPQMIEIFRFQPLFLNLSLYLQNYKVLSSSINVVMMTTDRYYSFKRTLNNDYILTIAAVGLLEGNYSFDIFAYDGNDLFATENLNLRVLYSSFHWELENFPNFLYTEDNLTFRIYTYYTIDLNSYQILPGVFILLWFNNIPIYVGITNSEGILDLSLEISDYTSDNWLDFGIEGKIDEKTITFQEFHLELSNNSLLEDHEIVYLTEIERSSIYANSSFYIYYRILYPENGSEWFASIPSYQGKILSVSVIRDHYVISTLITQDFIFWSFLATTNTSDILILELAGPLAFMKIETVLSRFKLSMEVYSNTTVNNFTVNINLKKFGLPISNITIYDSIYREITTLYTIVFNNLVYSISNLNIVSGVQLRIYLEADIYGIEIKELIPFENEYNYYDSIIGSWEVKSPVSFEYSVYYELDNQYSLLCHNTSKQIETNPQESTITAFFPKMNWNSSCNVYLSINPFSDFQIRSQSQFFSIIDTEAPMVDYSYEIFGDNVLRLHTYVIEPETASGGENLTILINDIPFFYHISDKQYNVFNFSLEKNRNYITIIAIDRAGNVFRTEEFLVTINWPNNYNLEEFIIQTYPAVLLSLLVGSPFYIVKKIKKKRSPLF